LDGLFRFGLADFGVHRDHVSAASHEFLDEHGGAIDHQVNVKWPVSERTQGADQVWKEQQAGREVGVGDVEVKRVGEWLEARNPSR
jgi:hypothetical protein